MWSKLCASYLTYAWERCGPLWGQQWRYYLKWKAGVSCRTSSQMWGSWNLAMFLLGDHWFQCAWPPWWYWWCCVLPYPLWRNCPHWWDNQRWFHGHRWVRSPEMFLEPFIKSPHWFIYLLLLTTHMVTLEPVNYPALLSDLTLSLGATRRFLMMLPPLKCIWIHTLLHTFLRLLVSPLVYRTTM